MPVRQLKRIGTAVGDSLYERIQAQTLHNADHRPYLDVLEREHAEMIVTDGANVLAAHGIGMGTARLNYGFENERVMVDRFPSMFAKLLPRMRRVLHADSVRLRLSYAPARPLVEPMLKQLWFRTSRDWMEFTLARGTRLPAAPAPRGIRFRDASVDDVPQLVRLDRQAFPDTPIPADAMRARFGEESCIVAEAGGDTVGFCMFGVPDQGAGWISLVAVDESRRGEGLGAALTTRATKRLFAGGAQAVGLTTDDGNGAAIRLYVRLGFKQTRAGRDYTRPTHPRAIKAMQTAGEGTLIRFGGWR